ncbi:hypothetical protein LXA43DRAFT_1035081 [Ganoderma leucocontextum]|nr:hypothetical protein LXA43DRAFT_1035081 [Ganoderma leucocontextum]
MATTTPAVHLDTDEFSHTFLTPPNEVPLPSTSEKNPFEALKNANKISENKISELLVTAINSNTLASGSTSARYTPYFDSATNKATLNDSTAIFRTAHVPSEGRARWLDLSVPVEVYSHPRGIDPFDTTGSQYHDATAQSRQFDRISAVAEILFAAQQRVFLFMLLIIGRKFRFLRLDRSGVIVTPSIDYYEYPHILCDILWRVSQLDDTALGFDPTVTRVLPGDVDFSRMDFLALKNPSDLDDAEQPIEEGDLGGSPVFRYVRSLFGESLASDWPRHRVQVRDGQETRDYLVGKPSFRSAELMGRGTCGYVAYDCKTHRFVWLKDAWRASYMLAETEGDVLHKLNAADVQNIPTLVCAGDVGEQATVTADWWERKQSHPSSPTRPHLSFASGSSSTTLSSTASPGSRKRKRIAELLDATSTSQRGKYSPNATMRSDCPLRQHKHYRIVVEEVCMPLKNFQYGRQLVSVVFDCLLAHYQAATHPKAQLLHCDISGGNALIFPKIRRDREGNNPMVVWTGILSDWELSKPVDAQDAASKQTQADRMGTYQFMSVNLLNHVTKPVKVSDELESFFHLLVYYAVRHLRSNCTDVSSWIDNYFHSYSGPERMLTCGQKSSAVEITGVLEIESPDGPLLFHSPMDGILAVILKSLRAHYKVMEHDAVKTAPPPPRPETPPPSPLISPPIMMRDFEDDLDDDLDDEQVAKWEARLQADPPDRSPTSEDRELARKVADHKFMIDHLSRMLRDPRWRANDRVSAPQASESETPSSKAGAPPPSESAPPPSNKLQRTSGPSPERNVSLPARLRASTRRTRTRAHARTHPIRARQ